MKSLLRVRVLRVRVLRVHVLSKTVTFYGHVNSHEENISGMQSGTDVLRF